MFASFVKENKTIITYTLSIGKVRLILKEHIEWY